MKESFQKIVAWAKAHPYMAGGIVLFVILLAVYVSKSVKSSGGLSSDAEEPITDLSGMIPGGSAASGSGMISGLEGSGGGAVDAPPIFTPTSAPLESFVDTGYFNTGSIPEAFYQTPSVTSNMQTVGASLPVGVRANSVGSGVSAAVAASPALASMEKPTTTTVSKSSSPVASQAKPQKPNPAQQAGKGKRFTGWIGNTYYLLGYPAVSKVTNVSSYSKSSSPVKSMSKPTGSKGGGVRIKSGR